MRSVGSKFKILIFVALPLYGNLSIGEVPILPSQMTPTEIYTRCHLQLTGLIPSTSDARFKKVQSRSIDPAIACQQIFELARLGTNGVMKRRTDKIARRVLERVHMIHKNWFAEKRPPATGIYTAMVNDFEEPALYYTRASLMEGQRFDSIFTYNSGLKGYRRPLNGTPLKAMEAKRFFGPPSYFDPPIPANIFRMAYYQYRNTTAPARELIPHKLDLSESQLTQFGVLQGVIPQPKITLPNYYMTPFFVRLPLARAALKAASATVVLNNHFGGGILGSQGFIQTNTNLTLNLVPDGEDKIHRRLTSRIYQDLLCHQLPTLRAADVTKDVIKTSPHAFRHSTSCMQCHTSVDPMAFAYRHLATGRTISANRIDRVHGYHIETILAVPTLNDSRYFSTLPPTGAYAYRTLLDKKLVRGNIASLQGLANHLRTSNDFYLCSAKKYYKYFTGVNVQLENREPAGTPEELHQKLVIQLSQKLKSTQSVSQMLKELFESSVYQSRDFLSTEVSQ